MKPLQLLPNLTLQTERLELRPISPPDRPHLMRYLSDPEVRAAMKLPTLNTPALQEAWWQRFKSDRANGKALQWCSYLKGTDTFIGLLTLKEIVRESARAELGYSVLKEHYGRGYTTEAARTVVQAAFDQMHFHSLFAIILPSNTASLNVINKLGFKQEGHFVEAHQYGSEFYDLQQFGLLARDFK